LSRFIEAAVAGADIPIFGDGRQLRDFTYVGDIVSATIAAAERGRPGTVYNVASSRPKPLVDVLDVLGEILGRRLSLSFEDAKRGDVRDTHASTELIAGDLGYAPVTTLHDGIAAQVAAAERGKGVLLRPA
jgi:nucleoside-diphosphate-sugar epimerase